MTEPAAAAAAAAIPFNWAHNVYMLNQAKHQQTPSNSFSLIGLDLQVLHFGLN